MGCYTKGTRRNGCLPLKARAANKDGVLRGAMDGVESSVLALRNLDIPDSDETRTEWLFFFLDSRCSRSAHFMNNLPVMKMSSLELSRVIENDATETVIVSTQHDLTKERLWENCMGIRRTENVRFAEKRY
jgi:hypothetical protein